MAWIYFVSFFAFLYVRRISALLFALIPVRTPAPFWFWIYLVLSPPPGFLLFTTWFCTAVLLAVLDCFRHCAPPKFLHVLSVAGSFLVPPHFLRRCIRFCIVHFPFCLSHIHARFTRQPQGRSHACFRSWFVLSCATGLTHFNKYCVLSRLVSHGFHAHYAVGHWTAAYWTPHGLGQFSPRAHAYHPVSHRFTVWFAPPAPPVSLDNSFRHRTNAMLDRFWTPAVSRGCRTPAGFLRRHAHSAH